MKSDPSDDLTPRDDMVLVQAVQRGDPGAFRPLVDRHLAAIHAFVAVKLPVAHLVDELTHETFVFAYRNIRKFTSGPSMRPWLRAIAANLVRAEIERHLREQANRLGYAERRLLELALTKPEGQATREAEYLAECLADVPTPMRELLALRYESQCSAAEIAQRLERSVAWVRTTLFRLRQQLKACIEGKLAKVSSC